MLVPNANSKPRVAANTKKYHHDYNWQVLNEYDAAGTPALKKRYIYGNYIDEVLYMYDADADEDYYYAHDHLYSPTALLDDSGAVVERIEYNAYGQADVTICKNLLMHAASCCTIRFR